MKKALSLALAGIISLSAAGISKADGDVAVKRVSGTCRFMTATNISREYFSNSDTAVIASGEGFVDALVGGTLTTDMDIPMFLVEKNRIFNYTIKELKRLGVKKVYILGGSSTISDKVKSDIEKEGIKTERIAGKNRFETAKKVQEKRIEIAKENNTDLKGVAIVSGEKFPDALVAAPFISEENMIMDIGTNNKSREYNQKYKMVIGGKSSVNINEENYLENNAIKIEGRDRFQTAAKVADAYKMSPEIKKDTVILVSGFNYPDALSASCLVKRENAVMFLTAPNFLGLEAEKYIETNNIKKVIVVGGESSVSDAVLKQVEGRSVQRNHASRKHEKVNSDTTILPEEN